MKLCSATYEVVVAHFWLSELPYPLNSEIVEMGSQARTDNAIIYFRPTNM